MTTPPDPAPTQQSPEVPEGAVEAAAKAGWNQWLVGSMVGWDQAVREGHPEVASSLAKARAVLAAALPAIQAAERERLASVNRELPPAFAGISNSDARDLILAALIVNEEEAAKRERERLRDAANQVGRLLAALSSDTDGEER